MPATLVEPKAQAPRRHTEPRCRVCKCSYLEPCNPPCSWAESDLCTNCQAVIAAITDWMESALRPRLTLLMREAELAHVAERRLAGGAR